MRTCIKCNKTMEEKKFVAKGNGKRVNVCYNCRYKTRNQAYKDRRNGKKNGYNISVDERKIIEKQQNGLCAICKENKKLVVDHCHITGNIRGLLCNTCNIGLGMMKDSPDILRAASLYLLRE